MIVYRNRYLSLLALFWLAPRALACECLWEGNFVDVAPTADLVVSGAVIARQGNALDLRIQRALQGQEFMETIRVWGDSGDLCRPDASEFAVGSEWVMALSRIDSVPAGGFNPSTPNISFGRAGDYALSNCGVYWLKLEAGVASGNLVNGPRWDYDSEPMSPVLLELIGAYLQGVIPREALEEAAKPQTEARKLLRKTLRFLEQEERGPEAAGGY